MRPWGATRAIRAGLRQAGRALDSERDRWSLWLPVAFGSGIALYFALPEEPPVWPACIVVLVGLMLAWLGRSRTLPLVVALGLCAASLGFTAATLRAHAVAAPVLEQRTGAVVLEGRVLETEPLKDGPRVTLEVFAMEGRWRGPMPHRVRVRLRDGAAPPPGRHVRLRAVLMPPPVPSAPGLHDFARDAWFRGIGAVGFALGGWEEIPAPAPPGRMEHLASGIEELRDALTERIITAAGGREGPIAAALMTGERGPIDPDLAEAYRTAGLAHLLAVSGLNMSLAAAVMFVGLRLLLAMFPPLALRFDIKKIAAVGAILSTAFYLAISGANVPAQRAFLTTLVVLLAVLLDRRALSLRTVGLAAIAVMILQPEAVMGASFQLSFAAVLALVAAYERLAPALAERRAAYGPVLTPVFLLAGALATALVAGIATAPFVVHHFGRLPAYTVIANVLASPLVSLWIMPWAVLGFLLMPLGLEEVALVPMGWGIAGLNWVAETVATWPSASLWAPGPTTAGMILVVLGGLWTCLWRGRMRLLGIPALILGMASAAVNARPDAVVAGSGGLVALRDQNGGLVALPERGEGFTRLQWSQRWNVAPASGAALSCDGIGCVGGPDRAVAYLARPDGLAEECARAAVVIHPPARVVSCQAPVVIDAAALRAAGGHTIRLNGDGSVHVETVAETRGRRPWAQ